MVKNKFNVGEEIRIAGNPSDPHRWMIKTIELSENTKLPEHVIYSLCLIDRSEECPFYFREEELEKLK